DPTAEVERCSVRSDLHGSRLPERLLDRYEVRRIAGAPVVLDELLQVAPKAVALLLAHGAARQRIRLEEFFENAVDGFVRNNNPVGEPASAPAEGRPIARVEFRRDIVEQAPVGRLADLAQRRKRGRIAESKALPEQECMRAAEQLLDARWRNGMV